LGPRPYTAQSSIAEAAEDWTGVFLPDLQPFFGTEFFNLPFGLIQLLYLKQCMSRTLFVVIFCLLEGKTYLRTFGPFGWLDVDGLLQRICMPKRGADT
jgi:hypothetical protein